MALRSTELIGNLEALNENIVSRLFQVNLMTTYYLFEFCNQNGKKGILKLPYSPFYTYSLQLYSF